MATQAPGDREGDSTTLRYQSLKSNSSIRTQSRAHASKEEEKWDLLTYCHSLLHRGGRVLFVFLTQHQRVIVLGHTLLLLQAVQSHRMVGESSLQSASCCELWHPIG